MNVKLFLSALLCFNLIIFISCGSSDRNSAQKKIGFGVESGFDNNYHPIKDSLINTTPLLRSIYSSLYKFDNDLKPYPFLVAKTTRKENTVIFTLKSNCKFSNGREITARDVVWSLVEALKYQLNPLTFHKSIVGAEELIQNQLKQCRGIKVLSEKEFQIDFTSLNNYYPYYLALSKLSILPYDWKPDSGVFSGAFVVLDEVKTSSYTRVTLQRNPYFAGKAPNLNVMEFYFFTSRDAFNRAIKRADLDIFLYNFHQVEPESDYEYQYFKTPVNGNFTFLLNPKAGIFKDKKLRKFFRNYLFSLDLKKELGWELASYSTMVLPYGLPGYDLFEPYPNQDQTSFKQTKKLKARCFYRDTGIRVRLFPKLKKALSAYNIELELYNELWDQLTPRFARGDFDLTAFYFLEELPLSIGFYEHVFTAGSDINPMGYRVPEAELLLAAYKTEVKELEKLKILHQLEKIAQDEAFLIPYINQINLLGYKKNIMNVRMNQMLYISFEDINIED